MIRQIKARLKGVVRRRRDVLFPDPATRAYRAWMAIHAEHRARLYNVPLEPGLFSIITAVWDGSPLPYFRELAQSITDQMQGGRAQWLIVANGCSRPDLLACLRLLSEKEFVSIHYLAENSGIVSGLRLGLEKATGRYILPVDADDKLYPDALRIVTAFIQRNNYPTLLYTDEDKVSGSGRYQPYFKPDWDPVLLANSAYIAHLGIADRKLALALDAYGNKEAEGSADWDLFTRFANAGHQAIHIPEVVYSWRIHSHSTADDATAKPYIRSSQEAVMRSFLNAQAAGKDFDIETAALFGPNAAHLRFKRRHPPSRAVKVLTNAVDLRAVQDIAEAVAGQDGLVGLTRGSVDGQDPDFVREAQGLFDLFPDTVMVGGRVSDASGLIVDGGRHFGFNGLCGSPDIGRKLSDPGYFGQVWKQRTVSAVGTTLAFIRASDLLRILKRLPLEATVENLGCWIGAESLRDGRRIIYSPFLQVKDWKSSIPRMGALEEQIFRQCYSDLIPDRRFYPEPLSLTTGYKIAANRLELTDKP